jgi:hypothetical protein
MAMRKAQLLGMEGVKEASGQLALTRQGFGEVLRVSKTSVN